MKTYNVLIAVTLTFAILVAQFSVSFAAPANNPAAITGTVQSVTIETDVTTAVTTVLITISGNTDISQTIRLCLKTARDFGLIISDENGTPAINPEALGMTIQVDPSTVITDDGANRHPVGDALATFFAEITDYETIMEEHDKGVGFGVIAQALWLTKKLEGDSQDFLAILDAKKTGDFSGFLLEDGTTPKTWDQFRTAVLEGDHQGGLGIVMSNKDKDDGNGNNGNGHGSNGNGNANGNTDKDKNKGNRNK